MHHSVSVIEYCIGNVQSVVNACIRVGAEPRIARDGAHMGRRRGAQALGHKVMRNLVDGEQDTTLHYRGNIVIPPQGKLGFAQRVLWF